MFHLWKDLTSSLAVAAPGTCAQPLFPCALNLSNIFPLGSSHDSCTRKQERKWLERSSRKIKGLLAKNGKLSSFLRMNAIVFQCFSHGWNSACRTRLLLFFFEIHSAVEFLCVLKNRAQTGRGITNPNKILENFFFLFLSSLRKKWSFQKALFFFFLNHKTNS